MNLRGNPVRETATLPDGRSVRIDVAVVGDEYIAERSDTVGIELHAVAPDGGEVVLASLNTVLEPGQRSEAHALAREVRAGLESGALAPTAGAIEELADRPR